MNDKQLKQTLKDLSNIKVDICKKCRGTGEIHTGQYVGGFRTPNQIGGGVKPLLYPCPDCSRSEDCK
jgi:hypothetical protein